MDIDTLKARRCADADVSTDAAVEMWRDDEVGGATYRLPSRVVRRDLTITLDPLAAPIVEAEIDADGVMGTEVGVGGEARKSAFRDALKAWYAIGSNAEADRRVYEIVGHLLGITEQVDAATGTTLTLGVGLEVLP